MGKMDKVIEKSYLKVLVTCQTEWVERVWDQTVEFHVGVQGRRVEHGFKQWCHFGPIGVGIKVDADLAIVLVRQVELWVYSSDDHRVVVAVTLGGFAVMDKNGAGNVQGSGKGADPSVE